MVRRGDAPYGSPVNRLRTHRLGAVIAGVVSALAGVGLGELVAGFVAPTAGPLVAVGSALIDLAPARAKHLMIGLFGTFDKTALLILVGVVLLAASAAAGLVELRRPPLGAVLFGVLGAVGLAAALTRHAATPLDALPALVATAVAILAMRALLRRVPEPTADRSTASGSSPSGLTRRSFLLRSAGVGALGVLAAAGGLAMQAGSRTVSAVRTALKLPAPATPAPAPPAGADFRIAGLAPIVTPNADFYRIDTALQVPQIDPEQWRLVITGMVDRTITLTWRELLALPLEESYTTLTCVSNEVGGDLIGNARWLGYPIRHLLERAGPSPRADMVLSTSQDGFTAGTPLDALQDPDRAAILAVGMNDQPLPAEHGFPVRMVVPGLYGYVSATKWVVKLEVTRYDRATAYWTREGWSERGPIKLQSRIDVVKPTTGGSYVVAGVAWHQHVGVRGVEVMIDGGAWRPAQLSTPISADTWVQWRMPWRPSRGRHVLAVRAIGADGEVQTSRTADVVPNGATGYHSVEVTV
jgi:DMSO/TMAO reductase YedYZ molybdopterin-dependent catalytic subunit